METLADRLVEDSGVQAKKRSETRRRGRARVRDVVDLVLA
jgi:hypothetical protein